MTLQLSCSQIASNIFGLSLATVHCTSSTTLDEFSNGVLVDRDCYQELDAAREGEAIQVGLNFAYYP